MTLNWCQHKQLVISPNGIFISSFDHVSSFSFCWLSLTKPEGVNHLDSYKLGVQVNSQ